MSDGSACLMAIMLLQRLLEMNRFAQRGLSVIRTEEFKRVAFDMLPLGRRERRNQALLPGIERRRAGHQRGDAGTEADALTAKRQSARHLIAADHRGIGLVSIHALEQQVRLELVIRGADGLALRNSGAGARC